MQEQMKAVQRMQEYIEEHLDEEITLANLSEVSLFSSWHSYRLFKNYLGMTPAIMPVEYRKDLISFPCPRRNIWWYRENRSGRRTIPRRSFPCSIP